MRYLIINATSPYNIIIDGSSFNSLEPVLSILYATLKYPLEDGQVGVVKGDQGLVRKCYKDNMKLKRKAQIDEPVKDDHLKVNLVDIDPIEDPVEDSLTPIEDVNTVQIGNQSS